MPHLPSSIDELDGPAPWPLLGNLPQLKLPRLHLQLEEWAKQHGRIFRLRLPRRDVVVVSTPEDIASILRARPDTWRRSANLASILREAGALGVFAAEGEDWRRQRRMVMTGFDPAHLRNYMPSLVRVTGRLRKRWVSAAQAGTAMDLQSELMRYSVDAASGISFGLDINTIEDERSELQENLGGMFPMIYRRLNQPFPYWRYFRLPSDVAHDKRLAVIHRMIDDIVAQARERLRLHPERREQPTDLLEAMLAARDADGSALSEADITGNVFTLLSASEDTTANTLAWTIHLLHQHPSAWLELVKEARAVLGGESVAQSVDQVRSLRYAEACASEAMRLKPVAPMIILEAIQETRVRELHIPRGTAVFLLMRPGAVDESNVEAARDFRPERWLADGAASSQSPKRVSMPFGAGPRLCPGRYLAMLEINLVLGMLASEFELPALSTPDDGPPEEVLAFTMHPSPLRMRLAQSMRTPAARTTLPQRSDSLFM
jgi:cytochrome P450